MVVDNEFKSQPCLTIYYTYGETLEGLSWCELPDLVPAHSILVCIVGARTKIFTMFNRKGGLW